MPTPCPYCRRCPIVQEFCDYEVIGPPGAIPQLQVVCQCGARGPAVRLWDEQQRAQKAVEAERLWATLVRQ